MKPYLTCLLLFVVLLSGCHHLPPWGMFSMFSTQVIETETSSRAHRVFITPQLRGKRPSRVVLVSSGHSKGNYEANQKMIAELANQIRAQGLFEVVTTQQQLTGHSDNLLQGKFEEREIARISRQYNADTVALVRVNDLRSYAPLRTAVTVAFIDSNESVIACGADGVWDLNEPQTKTAFQGFVRKSLDMHSGAPASIHFQSPNSLFRFAAHEITQSMVSAGY